MADITDVNRNYLELLMQNDPEYKAGLYKQTPQYFDFWNPPTGPLYNVNPTDEQLSDEFDSEYLPSRFEEGDLTRIPNISPKGPLHDIDQELSADIFDKVVEDSDALEFEKYARHLDVYPGKEGKYGDSASWFSEPIYSTSYSEWPPKDLDEIPDLSKGFARNVHVKDMPIRYGDDLFSSQSVIEGRTVGEPIERAEGMEPNWIEMNKNLMDLVGTKPTSPRNEKKIDATKVLLGWQKPADINTYAKDVLGHEFRHNILDMPGFEDVRNEVMGTDINRIYDVPPSGVNLHQTEEYGSAEQDMTDKEKEELFIENSKSL